uniref:CDGSH iron-sulfur domain-containing protein 3, mitochondrial-like n=1 Tax=Crassostrea virginica TaxID=6565 RepID=A0A8B8BZR7_CRAVI|nr:CDGSH iron-sulfur domain-containing protein 3, mitochondrial-like [Crassostrea virginica]
MALPMKHLLSLKNLQFFRPTQTCLVRHKFFRKGDNPEKEVYKEFENQVLQEKGKVYDELPAKVELKPGRIYHWCSCGHGHSQPLCDGTHKMIYERKWTKIKFKPVAFKVEEEKCYFLCNCKQTKNAPYCDGTHREVTKERMRKGEKFRKN